MKTHKILAALFFMSVIVISSCKKDPDDEPTPETPSATTGSLKIEFENMVGDSALVFNTKSYVNANNDTFTISKFNYYISNIKLMKGGVVAYTESESYHLLQQSDLSSLALTLANVPFDTYTGIQFMIGVDSVRNHAGAGTGALDPGKGMYWPWNSGYIMLKMEGNSPQSGNSTGGLMFHVGGFLGTDNVSKIVNPSFGTETAIVSASVTPEVHIKANLLEMFTTPTNTNFTTTYTVHMPGAMAKSIADNYADMFSVEHIHN